jgi:hypothetical protein
MEPHPMEVPAMELHHHTSQVDMDQDMYHQLDLDMDIILDIHQLHHHTMDIKKFKVIYFISNLNKGKFN